ncbi:MAG TPA: class I SAM-dependent methyltransferase [Candidatus Saccharimonadales bacterium]|nr:class I SAM-dependent methyltransferase [Candidatus Saccharimonadales bacterium]
MAIGIGIEQARIDRETIKEHLFHQGNPTHEGSSTPEEIVYLADLAIRESANLIGEVGFNAGISSHTFLKSRPDAQVVSFDIGTHPYVHDAKDYIDSKFPGRHTLILGDSRQTVPEYFAANPDTRFDLMFIDGGHDYEVAFADILNLQALSSPKAAVVMDDLTPWRSWGVGPTRAWRQALERGIITQEELVQDGRRVEHATPPAERVWALGRYVIAL